MLLLLVPGSAMAGSAAFEQGRGYRESFRLFAPLSCRRSFDDGVLQPRSGSDGSGFGSGACAKAPGLRSLLALAVSGL